MKDKKQRLKTFEDYRNQYLKAHWNLPALKQLIIDLDKLDKKTKDTSRGRYI